MKKTLAQVAALSTAMATTVGAGALLATGGVLLGATAAHASGTATYSCPAPIVGPQDSTTTYDTDLPDTVPAGSTEPITVGVTSVGVAKASATGQAWSLLGARKMTAITDAPIIIGSGTTATKKTVRMAGPTVGINNGGDTSLEASGTWGTWTPPAEPAEVPITLDTSYYTSVHLLKGDGSHTSMSPQNTTCTVKGGQNRVIDTVYVTATSTVTAAAASTSVTEGDSLEVSAEVAVSAGKAAGKVEFKVGDGVGQKQVVNVVNGKASAVMPGLEAGTYSLTATFVPTQPKVYLASSSAATEITISPAVPATPTTTTLTLDRASATTDDQVKATVTVAASGDVVPVGQARVALGGKSFTGDLVNGTATITLPQQRAGNYSVTGAFLPTKPKEFAPSSSSATPLTVTPGVGGDLQETSTFVSFGKSTWEVGTTVAVTAQVTAAGEAPAGRVVFEFDRRKISAPVVNGRAVVSLPYLPVGTYRLTAEFIPAPGFTSSTADAVAFSVTAPKAAVPDPPKPTPAAATTVTLVAPRNAPVGTTGSVSATVRVAGGATAKGTVSFGWNGSLVRVPVVNGVARTTVPVRTVGLGVLTASFSPAEPARQLSSLADTVVTGVKAGSTTRAAAKAAKKKVTVTVRTATTGSTCGAPVRVVVKKGAVTRKATVRSSCAGVASVTVGVKGKGPHQVTATYAGTASSTASTGRTKVTVR